MHSARHRDCPTASRLPLFIAAGSRARLDKRIDGQNERRIRRGGHLACAYSNPPPPPRYDTEKGKREWVVRSSSTSWPVTSIELKIIAIPSPHRPSKSPSFVDHPRCSRMIMRPIRGPLIRREAGVREKPGPEMKKSRSRTRLRERNKK